MNFFVRVIAGLIFLLLFEHSIAQKVFQRDMSIPVEDSIPLKYAWFGGMNNPMFSDPDLNNDGIPDLVIFDGSADVLSTFINNGTPNEVDYVFAPEYKLGFPSVRHWMLMEDFDCDGIKDLFKSKPAKVEVWLGKYNAENRLEFDSLFVLLHHTDTIFVTPYDVPAIADINGDGDLDLLKLNETATLPRTVWYYENQSQELTGGCEAIDSFELMDECWGNFVETGVSIEVAIDSCSFFKMKQADAASANGVKYSFVAFDEDGDGDKELMMGLSISSKVNRMVNDGTPDSAHVSVQDIEYPVYDDSYAAEFFAVPSMLDVDNDGLKDMVIGPRQQRTENYNCAWFYKNTETSDSVVFQFQTKTFLIGEALDFGEGAYPAFFDYNHDGLLDMAVGNYGYYINVATIRPGVALLENIGTASNPAFKLIDRDLGRAASLNRQAVAPAFGDMDDDGDADMIVGEFDGYLHYFKNTAAPGAPAVFAIEMVDMSGIDVGQFSTPFIYDVNGDSLPDLIVGEKNGNLNYFENRGTRSVFQFNSLPDNSFFGKVRVLTPSATTGYPVPFISRLDSTEKKYLLVGSEEGDVKIYEFNADSIYSGEFRKILDSIPGVGEGIRTAVAVADLNGDEKMEMVVGNYRGGLSLFSQIDSLYSGIDVPQHSSLAVDVFPNPSSGFVKLKFPGMHHGQNALIELYDVVGKRVMSNTIYLLPEQTVELPQVQTGVYFIAISTEDKIAYRKLVIYH